MKSAVRQVQGKINFADVAAAAMKDVGQALPSNRGVRTEDGDNSPAALAAAQKVGEALAKKAALKAAATLAARAIKKRSIRPGAAPAPALQPPSQPCLRRQ